MHHQFTRPSNCYLINLPLICFYLCVLILSASCKTAPTEQYGFITKLGTDTIAVESVTRQGNTVTSDAVDRFPRVRVRHTEINLNEDGSIQRLVMDIHTPSEPTNERERNVIVDIANNKVHIAKTDSTGTVNREFATGGGIVEAHVPQMYSLYELYFAAALKHAAISKGANRSPVEVRQFYIDREFDKFPLGRGRVTPLGGGKAEINHDWLSGIGEATMDSGYHMLHYSGARTTYKVEVIRVAQPADIRNIAERFEAGETKNGPVKSMSVRDTALTQIGDARFAVDYSRPLMRGRTLLGDVLPYDRVWRTGANAATQFTTSAPVKLAGMPVPAGTYTLWTVPHTGSVDLIVNKQFGQWGTEYNRSRNLGLAKMTSGVVTAPVEAFTISIVPADARHGTLVMEWGQFRWTAPIEVE